ncbi:hypothetical protein PENARI_c014G05624 [Penicillium arizonense]|uniref:Metallo-beta-lactamase domain-containing protein n=1 Tax=Penicillium arizonense TaxID=1835702 RepID=A0A1F5LDB2_PENAI|nr:hypothetical protein PENARI_c014G05624 [Penicillium arizonense]OGE51087.1 hypothetical protein PENARI_c014G05624 [Penicillium arizonense]
MQHISIDPRKKHAPTRDMLDPTFSTQLPPAKEIKVHPSNAGEENASLFFVGTATTIIEWAGIRLMTDPNFLHAGDHVHLGPGVTSERLTNPAVDLHDLPRIDLILLSHYHEDHFDREVEASLRRDLPIITTPHAKAHLEGRNEDPFTSVFSVDHFEKIGVGIEGADGSKQPQLRVVGMPGKHVPPNGIMETFNDIVKAIPPTNGWMLELGHGKPNMSDFTCGYRIYISGDTLMVDELKEIPRRYAGHKIDLMLAHLGGTTIPSPSVGKLIKPLALMVTMDAEQGLQLIRLIQPDLTIPIHYDDYDVFASPLEDFRRAIEAAGLTHKVVFLDRQDQYRFQVRG